MDESERIKELEARLKEHEKELATHERRREREEYERNYKEETARNDRIATLAYLMIFIIGLIFYWSIGGMDNYDPSQSRRDDYGAIFSSVFIST